MRAPILIVLMLAWVGPVLACQDGDHGPTPAESAAREASERAVRVQAKAAAIRAAEEWERDERRAAAERRARQAAVDAAERARACGCGSPKVDALQVR